MLEEKELLLKEKILLNSKTDAKNIPLYAGPKIISNEISESLIFSAITSANWFKWPYSIKDAALKK